MENYVDFIDVALKYYGYIQVNEDYTLSSNIQ